MDAGDNFGLTQDIYRMRREKSRSGCLLMVVVLGAAALAAALATGWWWWNKMKEDGPEPAAPLELPEAPVEGDLPGETVPDANADPVAEAVPAPLSPPVPVQPQPAPAPAVEGEAPAKPEGADPLQESSAPNTDIPPPPAIEPLPAPSGGDAGALLAQARERQSVGDAVGAREAGLEALAARPGDLEIETFLAKLDMDLLFSSSPMPEKIEYTVQSGDFLGKIAATFNTPVLLIARSNGVRGDNIRVGQRLLLLDGRNHEFAVLVSKSRNDLLLTLDGKFFKRYRVSTGTNAGTPAGVFKIIDKIEHPTWFPSGGKAIPYGDPGNLLGTHWLALDRPGYGLHGTWEPESIGSQSSAGCVRLLNEEIEELYSILPKGTVVTIVE